MTDPAPLYIDDHHLGASYRVDGITAEIIADAINQSSHQGRTTPQEIQGQIDELREHLGNYGSTWVSSGPITIWKTGEIYLEGSIAIYLPDKLQRPIWEAAQKIRDEVKASRKFTIPIGEYNYDFEVEVTHDGIEIEGNLLPWEWILMARRKLIAGEFRNKEESK